MTFESRTIFLKNQNFYKKNEPGFCSIETTCVIMIAPVPRRSLFSFSIETRISTDCPGAMNPRVGPLIQKSGSKADF